MNAYKTKYPAPFGGRLVAVSQYIGTYDISASTFTLIEKRVYYVPILIPYTLRIAEIIINVTTGQAGKLARLGLASIERGKVTTQIYSETVSLTNVGAIELATNLTISAGAYMLICYADSTTVVVRTFSVNDSIMPYSGVVGTTEFTHYYEDKATFGDNLADSPTLTLATGDAPHLFAKVA